MLCHTPYGLDKRTALPVDGGISYGFWCCLIFFAPCFVVVFVCLFFFLSSRCDINFVRERLEKVTTDPGVEVSTPHSLRADFRRLQSTEFFLQPTLPFTAVFLIEFGTQMIALTDLLLRRKLGSPAFIPEALWTS